MKNIILYAYESDRAFYLTSKEQRQTSKFALKEWKAQSKRKGKVIKGGAHPSNNCYAFASLKEAQKKARKDHDKWYYTFSFAIDAETIAKLFDGEYGADGPPFVIKKVSPLIIKKKNK